MGGKTTEYRVFLGIPEWRKLLKRPRRSLKNNIKMVFETNHV
jgi:hypothetical protein